MKWRLIVGIAGIGFLFIALGLFGVASCQQQRVDDLKEFLANTEKAVPKPFIIKIIKDTEATIPTLATGGTISFLAASVCLLTSTKLLGLIIELEAYLKTIQRGETI